MKQSSANLLVSIVGPTASGKTGLSIRLAREFKTSIVSSDSRQFYREMSIGTAKPTPGQLAEAGHHFIDRLSVDDEFSASQFEKEAVAKIAEILSTKPIALLTGGSGLYLHAVWFGFDSGIPGHNASLREELNSGYREKGIEFLKERLQSLDGEAPVATDMQNPVRIMRAIEICSATGQKLSEVRKKAAQPRQFRQLKIGIDPGRDAVYENINRRVDEMMEAGLLNEAESLLPYRNKNALRTVGYQELFRYFDGEYSLGEAVENIKQNTRKYAKRQMTWFRRYGDINWIRPDDVNAAIDLISKELN